MRSKYVISLNRYFLCVVIAFQIVVGHSQNGFDDPKISVDHNYLSSQLTLSDAELEYKVDSLFELITISDSMSINDLLREMNMGSIYDFLHIDSILQDTNWDDVDWNKVMKYNKSISNLASPINLSKINPSDNSNLTPLKGLMDVPKEKLMKCFSYSNLISAVDLPCFMNLVQSGKIQMNGEPSEQSMEILSACIDMEKIYENMDWNCVFKLVDISKFMKKLDYKQFSDSIFGSSLLQNLGQSRMDQKASPDFNPFNLGSQFTKIDFSNPKYINSKKFANFFQELSDTFMKNKWSSKSDYSIFTNKKFGHYATIILGFNGLSDHTKRFIVQLGLKFQTAANFKLARYRSALDNTYLEKDILIHSILEGTFNHLSQGSYSIRNILGSNHELKRISSASQTAGFLNGKLGNYDEALSQLKVALKLENDVLSHYDTDIHIDSVIIQTYNLERRNMLMQKFQVSVEQLEFLQMDYILGNTPLLIREKIENEEYEEALIICHLYKDLLLEDNSLKRKRSSYVPENRVLDRTYILRVLRGLYFTMDEIVKLDKKTSTLKLKRDYKSYLKSLYKLEQQQNLVLLYDNISSVYYNKGRYTKSFEYQSKSWKLLQSLETLDYLNWVNQGVETTESEFLNKLPIHTSVIANLAIQYTRRKDLKEAERFLSEATAFMEEVIAIEEKRSIDDEELLDFEVNLFEIHTSLAELHSYLNDKEGAFKEFQKCLKIAKRTNQKEHWFYYHGLIGNYYLHFGNRSNALHHYHKALLFTKQMDNKDILANTYLRLADSYYRDGNFQKSLLFVDSCQTIAKEINLSYAIIESNNLKGYNFLAKNRLDKAEIIFDKNLSLLENEILSGFQSHFSKQLNLQHNFSSYSGAIICAIRQNKKEKAFQFIQQVKARTLNDLLEEGALNSMDIPQSLRNMRSYIIGELNRSQQISIQSKTIDNSIKQDSLLKELEIINTKIRESSWGYSELMKPEIVSFAQIKSKLNQDQAFIEYFIGEKVYAFVFTKGAYQIFTIEDKSIFLSNLNEFDSLVNSISNNNVRSSIVMMKIGKNINSISNKLYNATILPIEKSGMLNGIKELIIAPDDKLYSIPFESLCKNRTDENSANIYQFLGDAYNINYCQSSTIYGQFQSEKFISNSDKLLVLSKSNFNEFSYLSNLRPIDEQELRKSYSKVEFIKDKEATLERISSKDLSQYKYLHLSTHAVINEIPELSYLALTNSQLSLFNMFDLNLNSKVTVLSACQTGKGAFKRGGGVMGFTRGLMYAGTESVVISLWPVEDIASEYLFNRFWANIASGHRPKRALQEAKQYLRTVHKKYDNPFFWAGFVLFGKG